jgi:putative ABC transport system ATP-binding protein
MDNYTLKTKEITKTFRNNGTEVQALRGINLAIKPGEMVAVMGPSGCGKSTLLHILGGLDSPTSGEVFVNDQRIDNMSEAQRAVLRRSQVGLVFQAYNLIGNLSVMDNVELPALVAGGAAGLAREKRKDLLAELGISDKAGNIPAQLSGGEKQRVALARALINRPSVLLADEPTGNLDSKSALEVMKLLCEMHSQGQTVLVVTHDPNVASIAQRVVFMKDGLITHETKLEDQDRSKNLLVELLNLEE